MEPELIERDGLRLVRLSSCSHPISSRQQALELLVGRGYSAVDGIVIDDGCLPPDFFRLKSGVAGELTQLFVNYGLRVVIIGDFEKYPGDTLRAWMTECNRGTQIFFLPDFESALARLVTLTTQGAPR